MNVFRCFKYLNPRNSDIHLQTFAWQFDQLPRSGQDFPDRLRRDGESSRAGSQVSKNWNLAI